MVLNTATIALNRFNLPLLIFAGSQLCPPSVALLTIATKALLTKNPNEIVVRNRLVLIAFIPLGDSVKKKSICPVYTNPSAAPANTNSGTNQNALIGSTETALLVDFATFSLLVSTIAPTTIVRMEMNRPTPIFCKFVKPETVQSNTVSSRAHIEYR